MELACKLPCQLKGVSNFVDGVKKYDTLCIVEEPQVLSVQFADFRTFDDGFDTEVTCFKLPQYNCRIVFSPIGKLDDYDDVRVYALAARKAIARALKAGSKAPLLVLPLNKESIGKYKYAALSTLLGALHELYVPIQLREDVPNKRKKIETLGVFMEDEAELNNIIKRAILFEQGRYVARDIGGGDPERMAPPYVVKYVENIFGDSSTIKMNVLSDPNIFQKDYPLFQAVNRAAASVPRHNGRIIFLEYQPPQRAKKTLIFVGKGVTYDTGGADIKAGGVMAGMSRDKCGAAAVAGFMQLVHEIAPVDIHVIGVMCMVRNSVGEECYVSDEVITSRAGVRIRVGNTDAEGRMCMADALCQMKDRALDMPDPHLFTIATLTGHAYLTVGNGYSIVMDNGPARAIGHGLKLKENGDQIGNPFEISTLQREDFDFHRGVCLGEDVIQANNLPSSKTPRGHQGPAAFMILATGLDKCGLNSSTPLKYSHIDIAGSAGEFPYPPTGAPILALAKTHLI